MYAIPSYADTIHDKRSLEVYKPKQVYMTL